MSPVPRALSAFALITTLGLAAPAVAPAATTTFGSDLSARATLNTADHLNYRGKDIGTIRDGRGVYVHVNHFGADTALINTRLARGRATAPTGGEIVAFRLKGCARAAKHGPPPLTEFHFQSLTRRRDGAFTVDQTSGAFHVPVCGRRGADAATVTRYRPRHFCIDAGDFIDANTEGGFHPTAYPSGVQYQLFGAVRGSHMVSFIRDQGTGNGATFRPADRTNDDGWAGNRGRELLLQAVLGTGRHAERWCPGGSKGVTRAKRRR